MNDQWTLILQDKTLEAPAALLLSHLGITPCADGYPVRVEKTDSSCCTVRGDENGATLVYGRRVEFFRGLSLLKEHLARQAASFSEEQHTETVWLGPMADCSRNAVLKPETVKKLILMLAAMGHNVLMLYTEDTYEVSGEPYFGHFRGRYSAAELKDLDAYAAAFGIEMIPCIQALAHLNGIFRWPVYDAVRDRDDILLAEEEQTYALLDKMIGSVSACFQSRFINLGMDEAMTLGLGKYLDRHGYHKRFEIMRRHLTRVIDICRAHGLTPMIWSDMYLRTAKDGQSRDYYDTVTPLPDEIAAAIPPEVTLVFWDYYHTEEEPYARLLQLHKETLRQEDVIFAGGAWRWGNFCPAQSFSFKTSLAALSACKKEQVRRLLITAWGDDGDECGFFSVLPVFQLYAEQCYDPAPTEERLKSRFAVCCNGNLEDFMALEKPNQTPDAPADGMGWLNPCKYQFYQDLLTGLLDKHVAPGSDEYYAGVARLLEQAAERNPAYAYLFENEAALCAALAQKAELGLHLKAAYDRDDRRALEQIALERIPAAVQKIQEFLLTMERQWNTEKKPYGFDVLDLRINGVIGRLNTARRRLLAYLAGEEKEIPELAEERLFADGRAEAGDEPLTGMYNWWHAVSPNVLFHPQI